MQNKEDILTLDQYKDEVPVLSKRINAMVPPVETMRNGKLNLSTIASILNSGWECFLGGLNDYKTHLPEDQKSTSFKLNLNFNKFLIKSIELNEIKRAWEEEKNAAVGGKNTAISP